MVKTASVYDNFCKTGNDVTDDVIIWVQDGNCKKMARENFSIAAVHWRSSGALNTSQTSLQTNFARSYTIDVHTLADGIWYFSIVGLSLSRKSKPWGQWSVTHNIILQQCMSVIYVRSRVSSSSEGQQRPMCSTAWTRDIIKFHYTEQQDFCDSSRYWDYIGCRTLDPELIESTYITRKS